MHRRLQPETLTKVDGTPVQTPSPWMLVKISAMRSFKVVDSGMSVDRSALLSPDTFSTCPLKNWICHPELGKSAFSNEARVAVPARSAFIIRVIEGVGQAVIDAQPESGLDDLALGHLNQRRMDGHSMAFDRSLGRHIG